MYHQIGRSRLDLQSYLARASSIDLDACDGTGACTAACPFAESMDFAPHQIIRMIQVGMDEKVVKASAPWICTDCLACTGACPEGVDVARAMATVRRAAVELDVYVSPDVEAVRKLHEAFVDEVLGGGRVNDTRWFLSYKTRAGDVTDVTMAARLAARGRAAPLARAQAEGFKPVLQRSRAKEREP